jgi:hypothetical protein
MNKVSSRWSRFVARQAHLPGLLLCVYEMRTVCVVALAAQTADPAAFEVVSIKPNRSVDVGIGGGELLANSYTVTDVTVNASSGSD